ncbi:hypothetical protein PCO31111_00493 [Pandoraea communis]|uniref:Uncharacterized protein n=1 Tax=Pandoraea communis TaxID=2508297 RepID=A0A5E4RZE6_9BURK|nr:hypothetical protein PCO31111_00493 [Pandoraea communis]
MRNQTPSPAGNRTVTSRPPPVASASDTAARLLPQERDSIRVEWA